MAAVRHSCTLSSVRASLGSRPPPRLRDSLARLFRTNGLCVRMTQCQYVRLRTFCWRWKMGACGDGPVCGKRESRKRECSTCQSLRSFEILSVKISRRPTDIGLMEYKSRTILLMIRARLVHLPCQLLTCS